MNERRERAAADLAAALAAEADDERVRAGALLLRCASDVHALMPEAVPDWAWLAGRCAAEVPALGDARDLLRRAERGYRGQDRPVDVAFVCAALAELPDTTPEEAVALWSESADLVAASDEVDEADGADDWVRGCVAEAAAVATRATGAMASGDERRAAELLGAVHALSARHGPDDATALLDALAAHFGCGTVIGVDEALARFARARASLGPPGPGNRADLARIDLFEARALVSMYRLTEAEALLHAALPELRRTGDPDELESAEALLRLIDATGPSWPETGEEPLGDPGRWSSPEVRAGAEAGQGMRALQAGRLDEAIAAMERAARTAADGAGTAPPATLGGLAARAAALSGFAAILRLLAHGDLPAAVRTLGELDRLRGLPVAALDDAVRVGVVRALLASSVAWLSGDRPGYRRLLGELEEELLASGVGLLAARIALTRARDLIGDEPAEALRVALPAALAVDSLRFSMPDSARRRRWAGVAADGFDTAFRGAVAAGRTRVVAELLEVVRAHAVPVVLPSPEDGGPGDLTSAIASLAEVMGPDAAQAPPAGAAPSGASPSGASLSGPAVVGGDVGRTGLGLPPVLRAPWGGGTPSVALGEALAEASRYHRPLRSDAVAHWFPVPAGYRDDDGTPRTRPEQGGTARIGER